MKLIRSIAAVAFACSATGALAVDWRVATADGQSVGYVDAESVRRDGDRIGFQVTVVFFYPTSTMRRSLARYEGNCAEMSARLIALTAYRIDGSHDDVPLDEDVRRPEPGTNLHVVLTAACTGRWESGTVADVDAHAARAQRAAGNE